MSRRKFIESIGATCRNWNWSWAFVDHSQRSVIFGAWDKETEGSTVVILDESWQRSSKGRKQPGYPEALEYVGLVETQGYSLKTFPITFSNHRVDEAGIGPASISGFSPELTTRILGKVGMRWYASTDSQSDRLPEEVPETSGYLEGAARTVKINAYERNAKARAACIKHYGAVCFVCGFDFQSRYGAIAAGLIHVHHLVPIAEVRQEYILDPIADLRPVCPNCHAVIHRTTPPLEINEFKAYLDARK